MDSIKHENSKIFFINFCFNWLILSLYCHWTYYSNYNAQVQEEWKNLSKKPQLQFRRFCQEPAITTKFIPYISQCQICFRDIPADNLTEAQAHVMNNTGTILEAYTDEMKHTEPSWQ